MVFSGGMAVKVLMTPLYRMVIELCQLRYDQLMNWIRYKSHTGTQKYRGVYALNAQVSICRFQPLALCRM